MGNLLIPKKFVSLSKRAKREAEERTNAAKALAKQGYSATRKSALGEAVADTSRVSMDILDTYGNQTQSVPAALFTRGQVQNGKYTTKRNLIGNPFENIQSHIAAQRQVGLAPKDKPSNPFEAIGRGFQAANRAGKAFNEDPDIAPGVKFASGLAFDPTTYIPAGALIKGAKLAPEAGAAARTGRGAGTARGALGLLEGFQSPRQALAFTAGGAAGTELMSRVNIPGVPEGAEQFLGGILGGGVTAGVAGGKHRTPATHVTYPLPPEKRVYHNTPNVHQGPIQISPNGDIGPGWYVSEHANENYREGDSESMKRTYWGNLSDVPESAVPGSSQQTMKMRPKNKHLQFLVAHKSLTDGEKLRIRQVLRNETPSSIDYAQGLDIFKERINKVGHEQAIEEFSAMGWDGIRGDESELTIWKPNDVLEPDLSPGHGEETSLQSQKEYLDSMYGQHPYEVAAQKPKKHTLIEAMQEAAAAKNDPSSPYHAIGVKFADLIKNGGDANEFANMWTELKLGVDNPPGAASLTSSFTPQQMAEFDYFNSAYPEIPKDKLAEYISIAYMPNGNKYPSAPYLNNWAEGKFDLDNYGKPITPAAGEPDFSSLSYDQVSGPYADLVPYINQYPGITKQDLVDYVKQSYTHLGEHSSDFQYFDDWVIAKNATPAATAATGLGKGEATWGGAQPTQGDIDWLHSLAPHLSKDEILQYMKEHTNVM
jgi:hypothetical protein